MRNYCSSKKSSAKPSAKLTVERNLVHSGRWRDVEVPLQTMAIPSEQTALEAMDKLQSDSVTR